MVDKEATFCGFKAQQKNATMKDMKPLDRMTCGQKIAIDVAIVIVCEEMYVGFSFWKSSIVTHSTELQL